MIWKSFLGMCICMNISGTKYLTTAENIYVNEENTAQLSCNTDITYPQWEGPEGFYSYAGSADFSPKLGEKISRLSWGTNTHDLLISDVRRNDSGNYICQGITKYLYVRVVPLPPQVMESQGSTITGSEGVMLTLTCKSSGGFPESNIVWYKTSSSSSSNALTTETTSEHIISSDTYNIIGTHSFLPSASDDGVKFICVTFFKDGPRNEQQTEVTLSLNLKPRQPTVEQLSTVIAGNSVDVRCRTTGSRPAAVIYWSYLNANITGSSTTELDSSSNTYTVVSVLTRQVTAEDNGQSVMCIVTHILVEPSQLIATLNLNVQFKPLITTISGNTNIVANGNNLLRLTCTSGSSNPSSDIEWKSNTDIPLNIGSLSNITGEYGGMKSSRAITLTPTRENDGDTLSCQATNTIGTSTKTTASLDLKYRPLIQSMSEVIVVEGNNTELTCIASSKPASTFKWYREGQPSSTLKQGTGTLDNNKLSYTIHAVKRSDASTYTCNADNGIEMADNQNVHLIVHYPPDVTPRTTNTTVNEASAMITCDASGIPNINYKYGKWIQTWPGYSTPVSEKDGSKILELTQLTYEHSGIYKCSASNGIKVFGTNQEFQEGSVQLLVKSFPIITNWTEKNPARLKENATVKLDFYSNIDGSTVKCYKIVNGSEETQVSCFVSEAAVEVDLSVFTHIIKTVGRRAMIMIEIQTEKDFGFYKVVVQNKINSTSRSVQIVPKGPPSVPYNLTVDEVQINTAHISWIRGFHGGFAQTFVIQFSTDLTVWRNKSVDGGLSESKEAVSTVLSGLKDSTTYYVRMYAVNQEGKSQYTDILNYTTSFVEEKPPSSSALIGGAAGGSAALIVILAVVVVITLRRRGFFVKDKSSTHADKSDRKPVYEYDDDNDVGMQDNPMYESAGPRNQGQSASASETCDDGAVYSTVDKKTPFIGNSNAEVDKSKNTGQKPGKKEISKSKPDKKGKKAAKEGELYANAAATEMKITKTKQNVNNETIYENPEPSKQKVKTNVNKDGMIYADLTFNDQPKGQKKLVIHGLDSMTEYVEVDFTKKADPLPDSDDENDSQRK